MTKSRREFLRRSCGALSAAALVSSVERLGMINAFARPVQNLEDYKALVCVFLGGGNDSDNIIIPYDTYDEGYGRVRSSGATVGIPKAALVNTLINPPSIGSQFGFHPVLTGLHALWDQGKVAVVCNVGPLAEPTTRETYRSGQARRPYQLFSHSDQVEQWQTSVSTRVGQTGWGGNAAAQVAYLNPGSFPMSFTMTGVPVFLQTISGRARPIALAPGTTLSLLGFPNPPDNDVRYRAMRELQTVDGDHTLVRTTSDLTSSAIQYGPVLSNLPTLTTTFPNTGIGNQLMQAARIIKLNQNMGDQGLKRQIFFASIGGFDLHANQVNAGNPTAGNHANLWTQVSQAMSAFYAATEELGVASQVTAFTESDFARTFKPNGNVGTDHAWGGHHFVVGGAVLGGDFYGEVGPNGTVFPTLAPNGPDDSDAGGGARGRWVPRTAVDQYGGTLAKWFGVADADITAVFPNIGRFERADLGFLG
jgi:uncharacterized protein (DUF1501 family)